MKKLKVIIFCSLSFCLSVNGQFKYRDIRNQYNPRMYVPKVGDVYNPGLTGFASFMVPGLGQMICGEGERGVGFFTTSMVFYAISLTNLRKAATANIYSHSDYSKKAFIAAIGAASISIISIIDAARVAKVKNMAYRDQETSRMHLQLKPYLDQNLSIEGKNTHGGLSLAMLEFDRVKTLSNQTPSTPSPFSTPFQHSVHCTWALLGS